MSEVQEIKELSAEFWASQKFESASAAIPLDGLMDNDEMSARGINEGRWMRACAVILQDDDEQLYAKFEDDETAAFWLDFMEHWAHSSKAKRLVWIYSRLAAEDWLFAPVATNRKTSQMEVRHEWCDKHRRTDEQS